MVEQRKRHRVVELGQRDRFFDDGFVLGQLRMRFVKSLRETREVNDFQPWLALAHLGGELVAAHLRHHDVGQQQFEGLLVVGAVERSRSTVAEGDVITEFSERAVDKTPHRFFVIDGQDSRTHFESQSYSADRPFAFIALHCSFVSHFASFCHPCTDFMR